PFASCSGRATTCYPGEGRVVSDPSLQVGKSWNLRQYLFEALDRAQVAASGAGLRHSDNFSDLTGRKLLEVLEGEHFSIHRVHAVECFLHHESCFRFDGCLRWRSELTEKVGSQRYRIGLGQTAAVERHLAVGIPKLSAEVPAVNFSQL